MQIIPWAMTFKLRCTFFFKRQTFLLTSTHCEVQGIECFGRNQKVSIQESFPETYSAKNYSSIKWNWRFLKFLRYIYTIFKISNIKMFARLSRSFFRFVLAVQITRPDLKKQAYKPYHYFRLWSRSQNLCYSLHTVKMYFSRRSLQQVNLRALYLNCCPGGDSVKRLIIQAVDLKHQFTNKTLKVSTVQHSKREIEKNELIE